MVFYLFLKDVKRIGVEPGSKSLSEPNHAEEDGALPFDLVFEWEGASASESDGDSSDSSDGYGYGYGSDSDSDSDSDDPESYRYTRGFYRYSFGSDYDSDDSEHYIYYREAHPVDIIQKQRKPQPPRISSPGFFHNPLRNSLADDIDHHMEEFKSNPVSIPMAPLILCLACLIHGITSLFFSLASTLGKIEDEVRDNISSFRMS